MNERLTDLANLRPEMDGWSAEMHGHFDEMDRRFNSQNALLYTLGAGVIGMLVPQVFILLQIVASG